MAIFAEELASSRAWGNRLCIDRTRTGKNRYW